MKDGISGGGKRGGVMSGESEMAAKAASASKIKQARGNEKHQQCNESA